MGTVESTYFSLLLSFFCSHFDIGHIRLLVVLTHPPFLSASMLGIPTMNKLGPLNESFMSSHRDTLMHGYTWINIFCTHPLWGSNRFSTRWCAFSQLINGVHVNVNVNLVSMPNATVPMRTWMGQTSSDMALHECDMCVLMGYSCFPRSNCAVHMVEVLQLVLNCVVRKLRRGG